MIPSIPSLPKVEDQDRHLSLPLIGFDTGQLAKLYEPEFAHFKMDAIQTTLMLDGINKICTQSKHTSWHKANIFIFFLLVITLIHIIICLIHLFQKGLKNVKVLGIVQRMSKRFQINIAQASSRWWRFKIDQKIVQLQERHSYEEAVVWSLSQQVGGLST